MSTVAMRWPPFSGRALTWSWKKSWCGSYFCAAHEQLVSQGRCCSALNSLMPCPTLFTWGEVLKAP